MVKANEYATRQRLNAFAPDNRPTHMRHPVAARVLELVDKGDEVMPIVLRELFRLRVLGVEITPQVAENVVAKARRWLEPKPAQPLPTTTSPKRVRAKTGRFSDVSIEIDVVYYMRIGDRVKIGTSRSLRERLRAINPEELMAIELGGAALEAARHHQFAALRTHGEWFKLDDRLAAHIESLKLPE